MTWNSAHLRLWLTLIMLGSGNLATAEEVRHALRYQFRPGESVYFTSHNETARRYLQNSHEIETNDAVDALKHYQVLSVTPEGAAVLELTIDRTRMSVANGDSLFTYDSTRDRNPPSAFQIVHETVGRPWLRVTVNPRGEMTNFQTPGGTPVPESTDFVSRVLPVLPEQAVAVGEVWKEPFTVDVPTGDLEVREGQPLTRPINLQRVYKLASVENGVATLELRTEVLTARRTPKEEVALVQRKFSGSIVLDLPSGRLLSRDLAIDGGVVGYDGPMSAMTVKMLQQDRYAPEGVATGDKVTVTK